MNVLSGIDMNTFLYHKYINKDEIRLTLPQIILIFMYPTHSIVHQIKYGINCDDYENAMNCTLLCSQVFSIY